MIMFKILLWSAMLLCTKSISNDTKRWLSKNKSVFKKMIYTENQIMNFKNSENDYPTAHIKPEAVKVFWTKYTHPPSCSKRLRRWFDTIRVKRSECSACCSTAFSAVAPLKVDYNSKEYEVYHPTGGWQFLFVGDCPASATCSSGTCQRDDDYHTWILVVDEDMTYVPQLRFIPISYPRYCKCVNSV
ncbi:uncharacterized protein LOC127738160 [Mytilus californianus]|uniref:uncharacterized protein LOC127738160 n=1 Tax=Mytilus californianus TaxID=6549 RepID=UPI002245B49B|nr:uncharacterized protein LOC127738160 [Mytilus californianus]